MRILLIEDDSATAQSIELMLKSEGFNVYTTDLGEEGIDLGKVYDYDIILLDLKLPDMSGFEVLRSLRVSKVKTSIFILSGLPDIEDKVRGLGFGADDSRVRLSIRSIIGAPTSGQRPGHSLYIRASSIDEDQFPAWVADDEARAVHFLDRPRRREASRRCHTHGD